jgi:hypothetical protein
VYFRGFTVSLEIHLGIGGRCEITGDRHGTGGGVKGDWQGR